MSEKHPFTVVQLWCGIPHVTWEWADDPADAQALAIAKAPTEDYETVAIFAGHLEDLSAPERRESEEVS